MNAEQTPPHALILGGFGRVGIEAAQYLLKTTDAHLTLASRSQRAIPNTIAAQYHPRIKTLVLDATDTVALRNACENVDVLIACIGPSGVVGDQVAQVCKQTQTPLVDAGGYDPVLHSLEKAESTDPTPVPLIINVGLLPGLSGMYPQYLLETQAKGKKVTQLDVHYVGRDAWTYNSAWDIINSLGGFGCDRGFCYLDKNEIHSVSMGKASRKITFPAPIGKVSTMLLYAEEIVRLAKQHHIQTAKVFGANIGFRANLICIVAKIFRFYHSPKWIDRGARWLVSASKKDMRQHQPAYGIQVDLHYDNGNPDSSQLVLTDTYQATGTVMGITARAVLEGHAADPGVYMLHEAIDHAVFMQHFEQTGLVQVSQQHLSQQPQPAGALA